MSLPFTSVVSYHQNPMTCGVAKFSAELAKRLGVPFTDFVGEWGEFPLFSLKSSEIDERALLQLCDHEHSGQYGVFWHDRGEHGITSKASHVFYADPSLGSPGLFCPSLITPRQRSVRLFSFGMAHKLQTDKYERVRELLEAASIRYHLRVSVGLHEGTSLDGAEKHFDALKQIMGPENVTILGILSDDAVSEELANCDYVLAFFEKGLRANNTTVHAAHDAGKLVITNWDSQTASGMIHGTRDINALTEWPSPRRDWHSAYIDYSWDALIGEMKGVCERSKSTAV